MKVKTILRKIHRATPEGKLRELEKKLYKRIIKEPTPKDKDIAIKKSGRVYRGEGPSETWYIPNNEKQKFRWCVNFLETHERFIDIIEPNHTIIEVGAATGEYTIPAAKRLEDGLLYAFEPEERNYKCLEENISLNSINNIKPENKIVSNKDGQNKRFRVNRESIADHTLNPEEHSEVISHEIEDDDVEDIQKKTLTLDTYCEENEINNIDILKVTANKHELEVLEGSKKVLGRTEKVILNSPYEEVVEFLENHGFSIVETDEGKPTEKSGILLEKT